MPRRIESKQQQPSPDPAVVNDFYGAYILSSTKTFMLLV